MEEVEIEIDEDIYQEILKVVESDDRFSTPEEYLEYVIEHIVYGQSKGKI